MSKSLMGAIKGECRKTKCMVDNLIIGMIAARVESTEIGGLDTRILENSNNVAKQRI